MSSTPQSGADVLKRIRRAPVEESVEICPRSPLIDEWTAANDELTEIVASETRTRLGDGVSKAQVAAAQRVQAVEQEIEDSAVTFTLRALPPDRWRALCDEHPPRRSNEFDLFAGYDRDAVMDDAVRMCMVSPEFDDCTTPGCQHDECGTWQEFVACCNAGEWNELRRVADRVNGGVMERPKSELASRVLSRGASISKRRGRGASVPDASTAGNHNGSSSTTAQTDPPVAPPTPTPRSSPSSRSGTKSPAAG